MNFCVANSKFLKFLGSICHDLREMLSFVIQIIHLANSSPLERDQLIDLTVRVPSSGIRALDQSHQVQSRISLFPFPSVKLWLLLRKLVWTMNYLDKTLSALFNRNSWLLSARTDLLSFRFEKLAHYTCLHFFYYYFSKTWKWSASRIDFPLIGNGFMSHVSVPTLELTENWKNWKAYRASGKKCSHQCDV